MSRVFRSCLFLLMLGFCVRGGYAADPANNPSQSKPTIPAASQMAPLLQVPEATHDFGEVLEGGEVAHDFKIKNTGKGELQIEQVRPG
jgi:hypothetical protein